MKMRAVAVAIAAIAMTMMLFGCSQAQQPSSNPQASSTVETAKPEVVELTNSYTTRFAQVNHVTFPAFAFDYPDGWTITEEAVESQKECVCLTNDEGVKVYFAMTPAGNAGYNLKMQDFTADISPIASSSFKPGYVQAEDLSKLGSFSVMSVDIANGDRKEEIYCVLPDSSAGANVSLAGPFDKALAFPYVVDIAFYAFGPDNVSLEGEAKQEVIAMLSSFRCA